MSDELALACFGKTPSRGDFIRGTQNGTLTNSLDQWLTHGLDLLCADPRWKQIYDQASDTRFAFLGVRSRVALAGHLVPSRDSAGRRFPLVVTGSFHSEAPLELMALSPLALDALWGSLEAAAGALMAGAETADALTTMPRHRPGDANARLHLMASFKDFLAHHTLRSAEQLLAREHPGIDLRRLLLALGLLLQPVTSSGMSRLDKGLTLPLPLDPLYAPLIGALWLRLVTPFVSRGDFELALFLPTGSPERPPRLSIGFAGGSADTLLAVLDPDKSAEVFVDLRASDWVDAQAVQDPGLRKLSSYLQQPQLSLAQALTTFNECFLGT